jgi:hypothetical protein
VNKALHQRTLEHVLESAKWVHDELEGQIKAWKERGGNKRTKRAGKWENLGGRKPSVASLVRSVYGTSKDDDSVKRRDSARNRLSNLKDLHILVTNHEKFKHACKDFSTIGHMLSVHMLLRHAKIFRGQLDKILEKGEEGVSNDLLQRFKEKGILDATKEKIASSLVGEFKPDAEGSESDA